MSERHTYEPDGSDIRHPVSVDGSPPTPVSVVPSEEQLETWIDDLRKATQDARTFHYGRLADSLAALATALPALVGALKQKDKQYAELLTLEDLHARQNDEANARADAAEADLRAAREERDKRYQRLVAADREFACGFDLGLDLLVSRFHAAENNLDAAESRLRRLVQQMEALRTNAGNAVTLAQRSHDGDAPYARGQVAAFAAVLDLIKEAAT